MNIDSSMSVCIIIKNEAPRLASCLGPLAVFEEIIVLDTGSTDESVAIAKTFPNVFVHEHPTTNLAEARNIAMSFCSGAWIFFLDADDWLDAATPAIVEATVRSDKADAYAVQYNTYFAPGLYGTVPATRIVRNISGLQWTNAIHEDITASLRDLGLTVSPSSVRVHHMESIWPERSLAKRERNIAAIEGTPDFAGDTRLLGLLSLEYFALGDVPRARRMLDRALAMPNTHPRVALFRAQLALLENDPLRAACLGHGLMEAGVYRESVLTLLTRAAFDVNDLVEAERRASSGSPAVAHHAINQMVIAELTGRTDLVEQFMGTAIDLNPFLERPEVYGISDPLSTYRIQVGTVSGYRTSSIYKGGETVVS